MNDRIISFPGPGSSMEVVLPLGKATCKVWISSKPGLLKKTSSSRILFEIMKRARCVILGKLYLE
ncbi:MAG: hypothetical protein DSY90_12905 [Deltaproteobacteria bacterium]|nr:MAG: hypothetical protein DSY90_12905 [Deltaproteobacteria bacterium]